MEVEDGKKAWVVVTKHRRKRERWEAMVAVGYYRWLVVILTVIS